MKAFATILLLSVCIFGVALTGNPIAYAATPAGRYLSGSGTVYDVKTKLTWQQVVPTTTYTWANAKAYCSSAAVSAALGGTGWRLPTFKELLTLVDFSSSTLGTIDPIVFSGTPANFFWSSTLDTSGTIAWNVAFNGGGTLLVRTTVMSASIAVRCVR